jgi:hypothetical protein
MASYFFIDSLVDDAAQLQFVGSSRHWRSPQGTDHLYTRICTDPHLYDISHTHSHRDIQHAPWNLFLGKNCSLEPFPWKGSFLGKNHSLEPVPWKEPLLGTYSNAATQRTTINSGIPIPSL